MVHATFGEGPDSLLPSRRGYLWCFAGPPISIPCTLRLEVVFSRLRPLVLCIMIAFLRLAELEEHISSNDMEGSPDYLSERWCEVRAPLYLGAATSTLTVGIYSLVYCLRRQSRA